MTILQRQGDIVMLDGRAGVGFKEFADFIAGYNTSPIVIGGTRLSRP